jgi:molecular chaperone GrpE
MPSNGSRHNDDALGRSGTDDGDRREGQPLSPDRHSPDREVSDQGGPRVRDLRGSRDTGTGNTGRGDPRDAYSARVVNDPSSEVGWPSVDNARGNAAEGDDVAEAEIVGEEEIESVMKERDELLDTLKRTMADFDNYRKRIERQSAELRDRANQRIVEALLPALDAFSLARAHLGDKEQEPEVRALLAAASLFEDALSKEGLTKLEAEGAPFDPASHEAVEHVPAGEVDPHDADGPGSPNTGPGATDSSADGPVVIGVLRPGYLWKGRVIRPAMVRVRG